MAAVELDSLTKYFGEGAALDCLTLTVAHGSLVCLLGPSGCGKTTTLRLVAGFLDPDQGSIRVGGRTMSEPGRTVPPERRGMSMIFQSYALWPHMT
ncbi:MAG TPA: ATP-binding cassette domain-containing protein, partial [Stellaceae bacterium]|nr:ATP-binding cassette domain-containing protein [Stellaceae bacterium]